MSEHIFSHGPEVLPPRDVAAVLERVAKAHGLAVVTYPARAPLDPRWAFHGPNHGWLEAEQLEDHVRAALDADPAFRAWVVAYERQHGL